MEANVAALTAKLQEAGAVLQGFGSRFAFHPDSLNSERVIVHGLEFFWLIVFSGVFITSCLMNRFYRFFTCCVSSVVFYFLAVQVNLPWVKAISFGNGPFFLTFDSAPLYLFFVLPVIAFIADVIARESFRASPIMGGIIASLFNALMTFPVSVLAAMINHILVDDRIVYDMTVQFLITLAVFQFFVTVHIKMVDVIFNGSKRFGFLRLLLSSALCVGVLFVLKVYYQHHVITEVVLPLVERKLGSLSLADLIPLGVAVCVMIFVLMGVTAGLAPYPSVVGSLFYILVAVNTCALVVFLPSFRSPEHHKIPGVFASSPLGRVIIVVCTVFGLLLSFMPLFNSSPIAESASAMLGEKCKKTEEKKDAEVKKEKEPKVKNEEEEKKKGKKSKVDDDDDDADEYHLRNRNVKKVNPDTPRRKSKK